MYSLADDVDKWDEERIALWIEEGREAAGDDCGKVRDFLIRWESGWR